MVTIEYGDIFKRAKDVYIVNPVNTVGVMGAGLAKVFKIKYNGHFDFYKKELETNKLNIKTVSIDEKNKIMLVPTKKHWKEKSDLLQIYNILKEIHKTMIEKVIKNLMLPAIGCGLGGLNFEKVKSLIFKEFEKLPWEECNITLILKKEKLYNG